MTDSKAPLHPEKQNDDAVHLIMQNKHDEAVKLLQTIIKNHPDFIPAYYNMANLFLMMHKLNLALKYFEKTIRLDPSHAKSYLGAAMIYEERGNVELALIRYNQAYQLDTTLPNALSNRCYYAQNTCDWDMVEQLKNKLIESDVNRLKINDWPEQSPLQNLYLTDNQELNFAIAQSWSSKIESLAWTDIKKSQLFFFDKKITKRKIKLGYLSCDLQSHPVGYLVENFFSLHDRNLFEVYIYSYGQDHNSSVRKNIKQSADQFIDISSLDHIQAATKIHGDQIDILIDLNGHTRGNMLSVCALRPAPIQITWLGFPGTTGAAFFDYLITDHIVTPSESTKYFSEGLVFLSHCYQVNARQQYVVPKHTIKKSSAPFVFSYLGMSHKITRPVFESWMRILKHVPNSTLLLLDCNRTATGNLKKEANNNGVDPERLIFAPLLPHTQHLARIQEGDLGLDTWTYNGHTTTSDCLWADVPVVALLGHHFASRVSASILTAIGLPELITKTPDEYEKRAVYLAKHPRILNAIKNKLHKHRTTHPLFDSRQFVSELEKNLRHVWQKYTHTNTKVAIVDYRYNYQHLKIWKRREIAFYCGPQVNRWGPKEVNNFMGRHLAGSEEAVIYLSRELQRLGWSVTVYAEPDKNQIDGGVKWRSYKEFCPSDQFNILVLWRSAQMVDLHSRAKKTYLWLHDILPGDLFTDDRLQRLTKIIVLSETHRGTLPRIPDHKFFITTNGIFEHTPHLQIKRHPAWCLWSSSYDRGLERLLSFWKQIRKEVPNAKLHIFYGWNIFDEVNSQTASILAWKDRVEKLMDQPGIIHHKRVAQREMEKWYKKCGIFTYPSFFYESSCISAIKAQAYGAVPVTTDTGALKETVQFGKKIHGSIENTEVEKQYIKSLIFALKNANWQAKQRKLMMPWAKKTYVWGTIAKQWSKEFDY